MGSFREVASRRDRQTLLDGMELEELRENEGIKVKHYLMVDAYKTWWHDGRSCLCRIIDMLHMGLLDEALFGYEVVECMPAIVKEWVAIHGGRKVIHGDCLRPVLRAKPAGAGDEPKPT